MELFIYGYGKNLQSSILIYQREDLTSEFLLTKCVYSHNTIH